MRKVTVKKAWTKFMPENCVFVISIDKYGHPSGMIAGWSMKCSGTPPLFTVALSKNGYTHKLIKKSKEFVIAVPNKELEKELILFGTTHGNEVNKFIKTNLKTRKAQFIKTPLLKDATVNFECKLIRTIIPGDHYIFIGEIVAAYINDNKKVLLNMGRKNGRRVFKEF